jgi:hypothetical protein
MPKSGVDRGTFYMPSQLIMELGCPSDLNTTTEVKMDNNLRQITADILHTRRFLRHLTR